MYCTKCGKEIRNDSVFCRYCGSKIGNRVVQENESQPVSPLDNCEQKRGKQKGKKSMLVLLTIVLVIIIVILILLGGLFIYQNQDLLPDNVRQVISSILPSNEQEANETEEDKHKDEIEDNREDSEDDSKEAAEEVPAAEATEEANSEIQTTVGTDLLNQFGINAQTTESYAASLEPEKYKYYNGNISDFRFSYSPAIYNDVSVDNTPVVEQFGVNLETIHFTASGGSELIYKICERNDNKSLEEMTEYVYLFERANYIEPADIMNGVKDGHGKVIVTGWSDAMHDKAVYSMTKIEEEYVLQMIVSFPNYTSEDDKIYKAYVTECYYSMCGFSDSSKTVRDFAEYLEANQG